jgi:hypothetical protein
MDKSLLALLIAACAHSGIQYHTSIHIDYSPSNPTSGSDDKCVKYKLYEIEGFPTNIHTEFDALLLNLDEASISRENCLFTRCIGDNFQPQTQTQFYTDSFNERDLYSVQTSLRDHPEKIKLIGCAYESTTFYILGMQTEDFSIVFHDSLNQVKILRNLYI